MPSRVGTRARRHEGVTPSELLVVIVIIGILAAIAISAYIGQRHKACDAAADGVNRRGTSATTYEVESLSRSGKRSGVVVDKDASGGITFYANGEARDW